MLTVSAQPRFIEKVFTDQAGRKFRCVFLVALVGGELKGRLVSAELISQSFASAEPIPCLPFTCPKNETETVYVAPAAPVVSPYNELFFFTSQPTRAPSFA